MSVIRMVALGVTAFLPVLASLFVIMPADAHADSVGEEVVRATALADNLIWKSCGIVGPEYDGCEIAVIRGSLTEGPADVFLRIAPGTELPLFQHSVSERGLMLEGTFARTGPDGVERHTGPGTYWYLPAGTVHGGARCVGPEPCVIYEFYDGAIIQSEDSSPH